MFESSFFCSNSDSCRGTEELKSTTIAWLNILPTSPCEGAMCFHVFLHI